MTTAAPRPKAEAVLRRLEWTVLRRLDGLLHGDYRSLLRGFGLDLADLREYQYHDDVRHIDWNVSARLQTPYVRQYMEDREVCAWFVFDLSPSVDFGSGMQRKRAVAIDFFAVLAHLLSRHGNRVGALFYGARMDTVIPARSGRRHVLHLLQRMLSRPELDRSPGTDLAAFLRAAYGAVPRRSLLFVLSDFISAPGWDAPLAQLARRHEVLAVRLYDPLEMELPDLGLLTMQDAESGEQIFVDTHDKGFRKRFAAAAEKRESDLRAALAKAGVDALELATDDDLASALLRFADLRKQRSRLAAGATMPAHLGSGAVSFLWPKMLWLLLLVPLLVALYMLLLKRRKKAFVRYASLALVKEAIGTGQRLRRHLPPALFLLSLLALIVAIARPAAVVTLPTQHDTVVLAMDVSRSMMAEDVQPNRITAAQAAARAFVAEQPSDTRIAIVAFAGTASVVQAPTNNREDLLAAIDRFQLQRATAIGNAIMVSLATIFPEARIDIAAVNNAHRGSGIPLGQNPPPNAPAFKPVPPGSYTSAVIILLTDGQVTTGVDPIEAARMAADRGVRIFTVGIGTKDGEILHTEGWSMRVRLDEASLKTIADITRGEYFYAGTAVDLRKVYETLNAKLVLETRQTEITALLAALAAALALLAAGLSLWWFNRIL